jgi:hypothetical protein
MNEPELNTQPAHPELPVAEILRKGIRAPLKYFNSVLKVSYPLYVILFGALAFSELFAELIEGPYGWLFVLPTTIAALMFVLAAVVGCHRIFILGPDAVSANRIAWFADSQWRYLGWAWLVGFIASLSTFPLFFFLIQDLVVSEQTLRSLIAQFTVAIPAAYLFGRFSLLLPAAATNYLPELSLGWGWELSRGNEMSLFLLVGLIPMSTELLLSLLPTSDSFVYELLSLAVWLYVALIELAFLSYSFEFLTRSNTQRDPIVN